MISKLSFSPLQQRPLLRWCSHQTTHRETRRTLMKVLAIGSIAKPLSPEQRQQVMPNEVPATLKLYLDGKIEQFWFRQDAPGVIFLMNAESVEQARAAV